MCVLRSLVFVCLLLFLFHCRFYLLTVLLSLSLCGIKEKKTGLLCPQKCGFGFDLRMILIQV